MRMISSLLLFVVPLLASGANAGVQAPRNADLVAKRTVSLPAPAGVIERKPVAFSWALDPAGELSSSSPFVAESREYWSQVDAAELTRGFQLDATAPGAVVRISPVGSANPVSGDDLTVARGGKVLANAKSFAHVASAGQLQQAGMDVSRGSAVVQLEPSLGKGHFTLRMPGARGRYLVHVFEPNSDFVLRAQSSAGSLLPGGRLEVTAVLARGGSNMANVEMSGLLVSPSGKHYDLAFAPTGSRGLHATAIVPDDAKSEPGLWEVQVLAGTTADGAPVQRDARTAIAVSQPTARLADKASFDALALRYTAPIVVGSPGRYELRGTLYATGGDGVARPVSEAHAAAWFETGQRVLSIGFERAHLPAGFGAPFEVRFLELKDQSRMGQLETRELAFRSGAR